MDTATELREQARKLQDAANKLLEAAALLDGLRSDNHQSQAKPAVALPISVRPAASPPTRLEGLRAFLKTHGPSTRREIIEKTQYPIGTIAGLLKESNGFHRDAEGRWSVAEVRKGGGS